MERSTEIQTALYTRLSTDIDIIALVAGRVFDDVPQGSTYPYIVIGDDTTNEDDTQTYLGTRATMTIHTWSRYSGKMETKTIMKAIYSALHREPLTLSAGNNWELLLDFEDTFMDPDGETRHGVQRFKIMTVR